MLKLRICVKLPGGRLNINKASYQYKDSHVRRRTVFILRRDPWCHTGYHITYQRSLTTEAGFLRYWGFWVLPPRQNGPRNFRSVTYAYELWGGYSQKFEQPMWRRPLTYSPKNDMWHIVPSWAVLMPHMMQICQIVAEPRRGHGMRSGRTDGVNIYFVWRRV